MRPAIHWVMDELYKFGFLSPDDQQFYYPNVWAIEPTTGPNRIVLAPSCSQIDLLLRLIEVIPEPLWVLYVLVVPRGESEAGRYESVEPQTHESITQFLRDFKTFFETDGRHHLWIASSTSPAMLVYDRHNLIYGYGPLDEFQKIALESGLQETSEVKLSFAHTHHYNHHFDEDAKRVHSYWPWIRTPLGDGDDL